LSARFADPEIARMIGVEVRFPSEFDFARRLFFGQAARRYFTD
jgi:hypothetical protein